MVECAIREALEETGMHLRNDPEAGGCSRYFCYHPCRHASTDECALLAMIWWTAGI